ncbi:MAG: hypothetical protein ACYTEK_11420 [Planctomycetota bacterium]
MEKRNRAPNLWLDVSRMSSGTCGRFSSSTPNMGRSLPGPIWTVAIGVALLVFAGPAFGQFTVEPMKLEVQVTPGKILSSVINFRSVDPNAVHQLDLSLVEVTQSEDGQWQVIEPNEINDPNSASFGFDLSRLSSCKEWVRLRNNVVTLNPMQVVPIEVTLRVPRGMRGFHTAGIVASVEHETPMPGMGLIMQFLIPVVVEIEGRVTRPRIGATDVAMESISASGAGPATTEVSMRIENNGGTFSRLIPIVRVWSLSGGYWRVITTKEFDEKGIIPGAKLNLKANLNKALPAGKYKLAAELYVDGRRHTGYSRQTARPGARGYHH